MINVSVVRLAELGFVVKYRVIQGQPHCSRCCFHNKEANDNKRINRCLIGNGHCSTVYQHTKLKDYHEIKAILEIAGAHI